jgi:gamma-glutamyl hydrolase
MGVGKISAKNLECAKEATKLERSIVPEKNRTMVRRALLLGWPSTALFLQLVLIVTTTAAFSTAALTSTTPSTRSPVIGILSQPDVDRNDGEAHTPGFFYIAASYVKWLEAGGARSIPIPYDATNELFDDIFLEIDGLLLPGGSATFPPFLQYALDTIVAANKDGSRYFPVWGTCLGYEFLIQYGGGILQTNYDAYNISLPLENVVASSSSLYADPAIYETVRNYPITMNNHHQGITPQDFADHPMLSSWWNVTSINHDRKGQPFVSTMEPIAPETLPIYGVQYHPEKNAFEYATYPGDGDIPYEVIDHSERGVMFSLYTARFFINLARRSMQMGRHTGRFPYVQQYPSVPGLKFELKYLIPPSSSSSSLHSSQSQQQPLSSSWRQKSSSRDHSSLRGGGADPTTITTTSSSSVLPF